jgi:transcription antitermination factor NusB
MSKRREGREWAVQLLFQLDLNPPPPNEALPEQLFEEFWSGGFRRMETETPPPNAAPHIKVFTEELVRGVWAKRAQIDEAIVAQVKNWEMHRIGGVERNVLRMGIFELLFTENPQPRNVVINEAVDIAKYFGSNESGRFINGVLDAIARKRDENRNAPEEWSPRQQ